MNKNQDPTPYEKLLGERKFSNAERRVINAWYKVRNIYKAPFSKLADRLNVPRSRITDVVTRYVKLTGSSELDHPSEIAQALSREIRQENQEPAQIPENPPSPRSSDLWTGAITRLKDPDPDDYHYTPVNLMEMGMGVCCKCGELFSTTQNLCKSCGTKAVRMSIVNKKPYKPR